MSLMTETLAEQVEAALLAASFPADARACGYRLRWDDELHDVADIVVILSMTEWDQRAIDACESARRAASSAFEGLGVVPVLVVRTRDEHLSVAALENNVWTVIRPDGTF